MRSARARSGKVNALVYVGDCMEEDVDRLAGLAGELGMIGTPVFVFQEGRDSKAERAFREIARLSRGAYAPFDAGSARQLRELLTAVAVYAAGGRKALKDFSEETQERRSACASSSSSADGLTHGVFSRRLRASGPAAARRAAVHFRQPAQACRRRCARRPASRRSPQPASCWCAARCRLPFRSPCSGCR